VKHLLLINIFIIYLYSSSFSQDIDIRQFDYTYSDSIALNLNNDSCSNISDLATLLTKNISSEHEKFRAIFRWITDNIEYSYSNSTVDADKVFKKKKAVCEGYASLLKALCDNVGIECKIIHGYAKNEAKDIGIKMKETNHAWNIVKLYDKWYLVDVTWASGTYKIKFTKEFDESYFLSDPKFLILSHFPEDSKYQFLDTLCKMKDFIKYPIVRSHCLDITLTEMIKGEVKKNLYLKFRTKNVINKISLAFKTDKYSRPVEYEYKNGFYEVNYVFKSSDKGEFTLFVDNEAVFSFMKR